MSDTPAFRIIRVRKEADVKTIAALFTAYTTWLNLDLTFQDFESELKGLPGKYKPPTGELLLAVSTSNNEPLGCVATRDLGETTCEIKRLYVLPAARGLGVGKALVSEIMDIAKELGYITARLDTLPHMKNAIRLYEQFGFVDGDKYYENPIPEARFMKADLTRTNP